MAWRPSTPEMTLAACVRAVEDRGAAARLDRGDGVGHGGSIVGRAGDRPERLRERRDDDAVLRAEIPRQFEAASRTKSMRRDMLWLLSMSRV